MAVRTTSAAVAAIIETDPEIENVAPFLETANALINRLLVPLGVYSELELELIERWMAAHFYAIRDPRIASEGLRGLTTSFQHQVGLNLQVTTYGQQACILDTTGTLGKYNADTTNGKPRRAVVVGYLGTPKP